MPGDAIQGTLFLIRHPQNYDNLGTSSHDDEMFTVRLLNFFGTLKYRRCATSRTVPGSIPSGVTGFFSDIFPSDQTMALGSTQPLVKMSTRNILGVKAAGA